MPFASPDKQIERDRYETRARRRREAADIEEASYPPLAPYLCPPHEKYFEWIERLSRPSLRQMDLCCGDGPFANRMPAQHRISFVDLSPGAVFLALRSSGQGRARVQGVAADAEHLPFSPGSFDLVTCAGSLSYFDLDHGLQEIRRVLVPGGHFVCVDSFNHNPIYRLNRWLHFLKGERTKSTLIRMPRTETLDTLKAKLGPILHCSFHGALAFLGPLLGQLAGPDRTRAILESMERSLPGLQKYAFKFVAVVRREG